MGITTSLSALLLIALAGVADSQARPPARGVAVTKGAAPAIGKGLIKSIGPNGQLRVGDTLVVTGVGFDRLTGVWLLPGDSRGNGDGIAKVASGAKPIPVTPFGGLKDRFSFVLSVPQPGLNKGDLYFLAVAEIGGGDTSGTVINVTGVPVRKITSVQDSVVQSGMSIYITGVGLDAIDGAYFGTGTPGSTANPLFDAISFSTTSAQVHTTSACNQQGILMLRRSGDPDATHLITASPPIRVGCLSGWPSGTIDGGQTGQGGLATVFAKPGGVVTIHGTSLWAVTAVVRQYNPQDVSLPFTRAKVGGEDVLNVSLPSDATGIYQLALKNIAKPVANGNVNPLVTIMEAPTWTQISPAWAEAPQLVTVQGKHLRYGTSPVVTVGGITAHVVTPPATDQTDPSTNLQFRIGAGTTAGPIVIKNEGGSVTLTGPFKLPGGMSTTPGFIVVSGPSSVTQITGPHASPAMGDTLVVHGQNLARLRGICILSSGKGGVTPGYQAWNRKPNNDMATSNTEMRVIVPWDAPTIASSAIQLYESPTPPGDFPTTAVACVANPGNLKWP